MRLYLYFNNGTLSSEIIVSGFSYVQNYYNNLSSADNYVKCSIPFDTAISNAIKTNINNKTKAVFQNDDGSAYFTGYLKQDSSFGKESRLDNISIEVVSPSYFLDITCKTAEYYTAKTLKECIEILLSKASITDYSIDSLPSKTIPVFIIEEGETVEEVLAELLKEYGYNYDFDENGAFIVNPIFNQPSNVTQIFKDSVNGNLRGKVTQKVSSKNYDGVSAEFDTLQQDTDVVIYDDTGDNDITANGYFGDAENGCYCDYAIEGKAVKYIESITDWKIKTDLYEINKDDKQSAVMEGDIENKGTQALVYVKNVTSDKITLKEIKITGSGYFIVSTGKTYATDGDNLQSVKLKYIFDEDNAEEFARNLSKYYRYANFTVSLSSKVDYPYGSFVTVNIDSLGAVTGRIVQKTKQLKTDLISYQIEAVSEFTPATLQTIYTRMPQVFTNYSNHVVTLYKRSTTEIKETGITGNAVYNFSDNSLTWEGGSANGWTDDIASATGDGVLYVTTATAYGKNNADTIEPNEWAEPLSQGLNGVNGYNTRTVQLFRRADASPTDLPLDFTLDFTQKEISITTAQLNGWVTSFPAIDEDNNPCWEIHVTALSNTTTDTITTSQWSTPAKISQDTEVTKAEIQQLINDSMLESAPVVYSDVTYGGFYVDNKGVALMTQSITANITVRQNERELDFTYGDIVLPEGFTATHDGNALTISVEEGTSVGTGTINIPVIYRAYLSTDTYGDEDDNYYVDEDGESYGYWILSTDTTTYNLGFGYSQIKGEVYYNGISSVASIPSSCNIGSYFTWTGSDTVSSLCKSGTFTTGTVYIYNGLKWQKDTTPDHLQTALSDVLSNAEADLENNNADVVALFRKISTSQAIINELIVTGNALVKKLQAVDIYADKFESYDTKAKGYADESEENAINQIESETGLDTLSDKTLISGGYIKTGLIKADALFIGSSQVEGLDDTLNNKASVSSVTALSSTVSQKADSSTVSALSETVSSKADSSTVSALSNVVDTKADSSTVSTLSDTVSKKADSSAVEELSETVSTKADSSTVTTLTETVNQKADSSTVTALSNTVSQKADSSTVSTLTETVNSKADTSTVNALSETVDTKADSSEVTAVKTDLANNYSNTTTMNNNISAAKNQAIDNALAQFVGSENVSTDHTIIEGGKIKTGLIQADALEIGQSQVTGLSTTLEGKASVQSVTDVSDNLSNNYSTTETTNQNIETAKGETISAIESETGLDTLTNKTLISGGKIKTDLIDAQAIFTDDLVVKDKLTSEAVDDDGNPVFEIDGVNGDATFNKGTFNNIVSDGGKFTNIEASGTIKGDNGYFTGVLGDVVQIASAIDTRTKQPFTIFDTQTESYKSNNLRHFKIYMKTNNSYDPYKQNISSDSIFLADILISVESVIAGLENSYSIIINGDINKYVDFKIMTHDEIIERGRYYHYQYLQMIIKSDYGSEWYFSESDIFIHKEILVDED